MHCSFGGVDSGARCSALHLAAGLQRFPESVGRRGGCTFRSLIRFFFLTASPPTILLFFLFFTLLINRLSGKRRACGSQTWTQHAETTCKLSTTRLVISSNSSAPLSTFNSFTISSNEFSKPFFSPKPLIIPG